MRETYRIVIKDSEDPDFDEWLETRTRDEGLGIVWQMKRLVGIDENATIVLYCE